MDFVKYLLNYQSKIKTSLLVILGLTIDFKFVSSHLIFASPEINHKMWGDNSEKYTIIIGKWLDS